MKQLFLTFMLLTSVVLFCACQRKEAKAPAPAPKKLGVITTLFPVYDFARTIGGDKAGVTLLPGPACNVVEKPSKTDKLETAIFLASLRAVKGQSSIPRQREPRV
jgi:ABC-type Zn uptake system ZnuABC Zn-binding protein ZnuA